jgi:hypothetical protein
MADVWKAELSFDGFTYTPTPDPAFGRFAQWWVGLEAICLPVADPFPPHNATPDDGDFAIYTGYATGGAFRFSGDGAFQYVTMRLGQPDDRPQQWGQPFIISEISGADPALLTAGGTLSITKDYDANLMTFAGPLGTQTCSLTDIDALPGGPYGYNNTTPLRARGYGERLLFPQPTGADPAYDIDDQVRYYNLIGRQNGVAYDTVALSAADPGDWWPTYSDAFLPGFGTISPGLSPWWTYTQLSNRQQWRVQVFAADYPDWNAFITYRRRRERMPAEAIDMTLSEPTNSVFAAWMAMPDEIMVRRTENDGSTFTDVMVATAALDSVCIQVVNSQLWLCYTSGGQVYTQQSNDWGASWTAAMPVPIIGTNARLVISPEGAQFYFYCAGGDLRLQRSFDQGATLFDASPITVAIVVTPQDFGAVMAADRALVVSYIALGTWITRRSRDWGASWEDA